MLLWCQVSVLNMFLTYPLLSLPPTGKVLIIGGSIANFTNVAATFKVEHIDVLTVSETQLQGNCQLQ